MSNNHNAGVSDPCAAPQPTINNTWQLLQHVKVAYAGKSVPLKHTTVDNHIKTCLRAHRSICNFTYAA